MKGNKLLDIIIGANQLCLSELLQLAYHFPFFFTLPFEMFSSKKHKYSAHAYNYAQYSHTYLSWLPTDQESVTSTQPTLTTEIKQQLHVYIYRAALRGGEGGISPPWDLTQ